NSLPESLGLEKGCPAPRPLRSRRSKNSVNSHVRKHAQKRISSAKAFRLYHVSLLCRLESSSRSNSSKRSNRQHPESQYSGNILLAYPVPEKREPLQHMLLLIEFALQDTTTFLSH